MKTTEGVAMKLTLKDVTITIEAEFDDTRVRGNFASGDDDLDRALETEIIERVDRGDVWAWAHVSVIATYGDHEGRDSLGCCSYASEADFREGPYYTDMVDQALASLQQEVDRAVARQLRWESAEDGLTSLYVRCEHTGGASVVQWRANARSDAWDVQDAQGYVYGYGTAPSLEDCQAAASARLLEILARLGSLEVVA